jgi:hypothetical protein
MSPVLPTTHSPQSSCLHRPVPRRVAKTTIKLDNPKRTKRQHRAIGHACVHAPFLCSKRFRERIQRLEGELRHGALGTVVAEVARLSMTVSHRLQLAAEGSGAIGIAVRLASTERYRKPPRGSVS